MKLMLIIDDSNSKNLALKYLKDRFPHVEIVEIKNQKQFYSALDEGIDAIITDYEIKWANGIKILIETRKRNPFMPVIMLAEAGLEEAVIEAIGYGLDDYILKTEEHFEKLPVKLKRAMESERARKREKMLSAIVENAKEAIISVDAKGKIIYANKAVEEIFGWKKEEILGKHMSIMAVEVEQQKKQFEKALQEGWARFETVRKDKQGNEIPVLMTVIPFKDEKGNLIFSSAIIIDIREQKKYEDKVKHLNEVLLAIRNVNQIITKERNEEKLLQKVCEILVKVKGYTGACISYEGRIYKAGSEKECKKLLKFIEKKRIEEEKKIVTYSFDKSHLAVSKIIHNGINAFLYIIRSRKFDKEELRLLEEISGDIAFALHSIKMKEILKREEELRKAVLSASPVGIGFTVNRILGWANETMYQMVGYTPEETLGKSARILYESDEEYERVGREMEKAFKERRVAEIETKWKRKDGSTFDCLLYLHPVNPEKPEEGTVAIVMDITEKKEMEKALMESEEKYRKLVENANDGICIIQDGKVKFVNSSILKISGYKAKEVLNQNFTKFVAPEEVEKVKERYIKRMSGKRVRSTYETVLMKKDGGRVYAELSVAMIDYKGKPAELVIVRDITERKELMKKLEESEKHFRSIFENATVGMYRTTPDGKILMANPFLVKLLGYKNEDELKKRDLKKKEYYEAGYEREKFVEEIERKGYFIGESAWKCKDGSTIYVRESAVAVRDENGKTLYYDGVVEDISELKKKEEEIIKAKEDWEAIFNSISDPVVVLSRDHTILDANPATLRALGKKKEEIVGRKCFEFFHESEEPAERCPMEKLIKSEKAETETMEMEALGGIYIVTVSPILEEKEVKKVIHHAKNITKLKELMKKLEESEEKYRMLAEKSMDGIFIAKGYKLIYANPSLLKILGAKSFDEIKDINMLKLLEEKDAEKLRKDVEKALKGEIEEKRYELKAKRIDGKKIFIEMAMTKVIYKGKPHAFGIVRDITERKEMEKALMESEERYRAIVEKSHDAIYIYRGNKFLFVNDRVAEITGYTKDELYKINIWNLIHPDDRKRVYEIGKRRAEGKKVPSVYEARVLTKNGEVRHCEFSVTAITYKGKYAAIGAVRDITERKKMEEALKESEKRFRSLVENAHDAIYIITPEGFEYVNPAFEKLTGYKSNEILSKKFNFRKLIHPDDIKLIEEREKARREGRKIPERYEFRIIRKDGKIRTVEASTVNIGEEKVKVIGMLRDVTERIKAEEKIKKLSDLHYLIGKSINRSKTVKELCKNLLQGIKEVIETDYANIFIYDENKNILHPVVFYGYPEDFMKKVMIDYKVDKSLPWEAVKSFLEKKERYVKDLRKYEPLSFNWDLYKKYDVKELYTLPLMTKEKVYGILQVITSSKNPLTKEKISLLKSVRDELSAGIARIMAEEEIRKAEEKYRNLVENAVEGIYRTKIDGRVLEINKAVAEILGYTPEEFLKINVIKTFKNPERRKEFIEKLKRDGEVRDFEIEYIRKDGKIVIARESARLTKGGIIEGIIHDVTKEREYEKRIETMSTISNMLIGKINLDEIYEKSLEGIIKTLGADGGVIFEKKKKYMYLRKSYGISDEYRSKFKKLLVGKYAVGISAKTRKPILIKDTRKDERAPPDVVRSEGYRSVVVVPVIFEKKVFGCIGVISRKPNYFSEKDVSTLQEIANQIAIAINSAHLVEKVEKALEKEREFKLRTAHYFFNPICIAKGFLELALEEGEDGKEKILKAINAISRVEKVVKNVTHRGEIVE